MQASVYIVSTPIGNLKDFSKRAIETLEQVDVILCEDTRVSSKLLNAIGIKKQLMVYNDHNAATVIQKVIDLINKENLSFALVSDAGTPLISDPGYKLVRACIENDIGYTVIPGVSAPIAALTLSGFPTDKFMFCGFVKPKEFEELSKINSTLIFFESPKRIIETLESMKQFFKNRKCAVVREITKIFEEVKIGSFEELIEHFKTNAPRGEFVILVEPPQTNETYHMQELDCLIDDLMDKVSTKELSSILSKFTKYSKNEIYKYIIDRRNTNV